MDRQRAKVALEELEVRETCTFQPEINQVSKLLSDRNRLTDDEREFER